MSFLISPVKKFHHEIVQITKPLPKTGKGVEITKRVALVVVSPFAYLALGFLGLIGRICQFVAKALEQGATGCRSLASILFRSVSSFKNRANPPLVIQPIPQQVRPGLDPNERCIFIQDESNVEDIFNRGRNLKEQVIHQALEQLNGVIPYSEAVVDDVKVQFVKLDIVEHSMSQYYLMLNLGTGETKVIRSSFRYQTGGENNPHISTADNQAAHLKANANLNAKLALMKQTAVVVQCLERRSPAENFGHEDLIVL